MTKRLIRLFCASLAITLILTGAAVQAAKPKVETGPKAEVTHDGLYRVDHTKLARVWVKPDLDLSKYNKIILHDAGIKYRDVKPESAMLAEARGDTQFAITPKEREKLAKEVYAVFHKELAKSKRYTITDTPGPDVLRIDGMLIDVVSFVPPDSVGMRTLLLRSIGEATLVLELSDSVTSEALARAADRQSGDQGGMGVRLQMRSDEWGEVKRVLHEWALILRKGLDELSAL